MATKRFISLMTIEESVDMAEEREETPYETKDDRTKLLIEYLKSIDPDIKEDEIKQWNDGVMEVIRKLVYSYGAQQVKLENLTKSNKNLKNEIQDMIYDGYDSLKEAWRADLPKLNDKIDGYNSEMNKFQKRFDEKNKEAVKLLEKHEEIQQLINEATPFEKEIAKLRNKSEEWSLFRGYAIRERKGKHSEEYQIPFMLCPKCCRPTEEPYQKGDEVTLIYRPVQSEYTPYKNEYSEVHPNEYADPPISQREVIISLSLWNKCKEIDHDAWHIEYMRRTDDYYFVEITEEGEEPETTKKDNTKLRTDNFDSWFADIKKTLPKNGGPNKYLFRRYASLFDSNRHTPYSYQDIKEKIKKKDGKDIAYNTIMKHLEFLVIAGAIKHNVENNTWQYKNETKLK